jgi:signal peptidase I
MDNAQDTNIVKPPQTEEGIMDILKTVFYAVVLALIIRSLVFEPFSIPSSSMVPNLLIGDIIVVSKYSYGYSRYSFPLGLPLFEGRMNESVPTRGEVAVFRQPKNPRIDYIKRVIGLPGDTIQVKKGILQINGKPISRARLNDYVQEDGRGTKFRLFQYRETFPDNNFSHVIIEKSDDERLDNTPEYTIPEGHYFMMGDNRDNSTDSRVESEVGFVPAENLVGRARFVLVSLDDNVSFYEVWRWPMALRYSRFLKKIE